MLTVISPSLSAEATIHAGTVCRKDIVLGAAVRVVHVRGALSGNILGTGTVHVYHGAAIKGDIKIVGDVYTYGSVSIGNVRCTNATIRIG